MIREFAIDPNVLNSWSRYEYFMADCGVEKGRLVAEFPLSKWKKRVKEAVLGNPNRTAKDEAKVIYHLQHTVDTKLVYVPRAYRFTAPEQPWPDQAIREHQTKPFQAIITESNPNGTSYVIPADNFDKELEPLWSASCSCGLPRTPEAIAGLIRLLCANSKKVKLLDPHFSPDAQRFKRSLHSLFSAICEVADYKVIIEVHTGSGLNYEYFTEALQFDWPRLIPTGRKVCFHRWRQEPDGEQMHRRLILSDIGGILIEAGLDAGQEGQTTTATLLSKIEYSRFWNGLTVPIRTETTPEALYEFMDSYEVTGATQPR